MTATIYADNGEISARIADGHLIIDAYEETPTSHNRVRGRKLTLQLTPNDAAELRREIGNLLRKVQQRHAAGPTLALAVMAEERVA